MTMKFHTPRGDADRRAAIARLESRVATLTTVLVRSLIVALVIIAAVVLADAFLATILAAPGIAAEAVSRARW